MRMKTLAFVLGGLLSGI